ncbi:pyridoxamine 5'-phosphate oxidase family protein [Actinophytocola sp.]|uniref:pyridoxamine 5'-phosphate oxidase family protein n=1 Tax=Actinophytocola sp. TaxID=1872138 RepID=UPI002EDA2B9B
MTQQRTTRRSAPRPAGDLFQPSGPPAGPQAIHQPGPAGRQPPPPPATKQLSQPAAPQAGGQPTRQPDGQPAMKQQAQPAAPHQTSRHPDGQPATKLLDQAAVTQPTTSQAGRQPDRVPTAKRPGQAAPHDASRQSTGQLATQQLSQAAVTQLAASQDGQPSAHAAHPNQSSVRPQRPAGAQQAVHQAMSPCAEPGSAGEHLLQSAYGTEDRAARFYRDQVLDRLNDEMITFVGRMEMAFIGTADAGGECDSTFRAGPPGFLHVLDERRIAYPEYRGNGVLASLGNISENPHVGLLMIDFVEDLIGLHVNGRARIVEDADLRADRPDLPREVERGRTPERWVVVHVEEAYVHCRKHIPQLQPVPRDRDWGGDDARRKGGDYFGVRARQGATAP